MNGRRTGTGQRGARKNFAAHLTVDDVNYYTAPAAELKNVSNPFSFFA